MNAIAIRFPMTREKTGNRSGPRYFRLPDTAQITGPAGCAARMVCIAIRKRRAWQRSLEDLRRAELWGKQDTAWLRLCLALDAHSIREAALWARLFARQILKTDERLTACEAEGVALRKCLDEHTQRHNSAAAA